MKLLAKTSLFYLIFSVPIIILSRFVCFYILTKEVNESNNALLLNRRTQVAHYLKSNDSIALQLLVKSNEVQISKLLKHGLKEKETTVFSDTLILDKTENVLADNRMITSIVKNGNDYYQIKIWRSTLEFDEMIEGIFYSLVVILFFLFLISMFINFWISKTLWQPFYSTIEKLKKFRASDNGVPDFGETNISEFSVLNHSLHQMMDKMIMDYDGQKKFTENASHEIQTPLAVIHERETRDVASAVAEEARAEGRLGLLTVALALRATAEVLLGEHARAGASGREALDLARDTGQDRWARHVCGVLAYLAAVGGDRTGCRVLAAEALGGTPGFGRAGTTWAHWALTVLDLGAGHLEAALARLDIAAAAPARLDPPFSRGLPDLIEALVALGHTPEARELTRRVSAWALRLNLPAAEALLARCRALVAVTDAEAETYFRTALELHAADPRPFDRARTELCWARWLHHRHRVREAAPHAAAARATFVRLQAAPWSAQAARLSAGSAGLMAGARGGSVPDR